MYRHFINYNRNR